MPRPKKSPQARERFWIGYCRKSTETEDKQIHTLQDQANMIQHYYGRLPPEERQDRPLRLLQEAQSAYRPGRPVFGEILKMASRGAVHGIIVVHPNRISRNHADSGAFVQRLVDRQIVCLDTTPGKRYTGADSNDIFMLTLEGAMSWKDSRDKGDRILHAMRDRAGEGRHMGPVPIGYRRVYQPDGKKRLELEPERAPLVRRLFELAAAGTHSTQELVAAAWDMGLRSRKGKKIYKACIHKLLRNPFFKGDVKFDGIQAKGVHQPIVEEAAWERVQRVLHGRSTNAARARDLTVRELFVFGNLLKCPKCGRTLYPYRAKGRYVYYECKNVETRCRVCVSQTALVAQLEPLLSPVFLNQEEIERMRVGLVAYQRSQGTLEISQRRGLNLEYEKIQREIGEVFAQRKQAEAMGIQDAVDLRLEELKRRRSDVQAQLNTVHDRGTDAIDQVVRAFELVQLLREAMFCGSPRARAAALDAVVSNFSVEGKNLTVKLRTPFRQRAEAGGRLQWWTGGYDSRTEVLDTVARLEAACSALWQATFA
jgi:DNA invertase Pin-like site-specific DNA recombinase